LLITSVVIFLVTFSSGRRQYDMGLPIAALFYKLLIAIVAFVIYELIFSTSDFWLDVGQRALMFSFTSALLVGYLWKDPLTSDEVAGVFSWFRRCLLKTFG